MDSSIDFSYVIHSSTMQACFCFYLLLTMTAILSTDSIEQIDNPHGKRSNLIELSSSLCDANPQSLGMESGDIINAQITASSTFNLQSVGPQNARLNREFSGGAWCPLNQISAKTSGNEWIQVDLQGLFVVTSIATQGRFGNGIGVEFVEEYWIEYSRDNGLTWKRYVERNGEFKLPGNVDTYTQHKMNLTHPLVGVNLIRIVPYAAYQRTSCLRFELYGCRLQLNYPLAYTVQNGVKESSFGDLRDLTYDGKEDSSGWLREGLGQLTDGIKGDDNYKVNYGYEWVGWFNNGSDLTLIFQFEQIINFTSVAIHSHNIYSKNVQVFSSAKIWFSFDGIQWSKRPVDFEYMPDLSIENARDVNIHLQNRIGMFCKLSLSFTNKWILISEINFNAQPIDDNTTITFELLDSQLDASISMSTKSDEDGILVTPATLIIISVSVILLLGVVVIIFVRIQRKRKQSHGHIVVSMKDLATTPLYCEPKDFSSTSSTISNTIADPDYAVPDVAMTLGKTPLNRQTMRTDNGHLTNNLNIFGSGMPGIFMVGSLKDQNKSETPFDSTSRIEVAPSAITSDSASNAVYHLKKAQSASTDSPKNRKNQGSLRFPGRPDNGKNLNQQQQHYASTDLIAQNLKQMTSNTIYTNKHDLKAPEDAQFRSGTAFNRNKQNSTNVGQNKMTDDMKCIPEIMDSEIEIIDKNLGYSRYGVVLFGRFGHNSSGASNDLKKSQNSRRPKESEQSQSCVSLVIVKTLEDEKLRNEFLHEMKSKWFISAKSDKVAKLIGFSAPNKALSMIIEHGDWDLNQFLSNCDKEIIGLTALLHISREVAGGMRYLESLGYVHRGISTRNCIIYVHTLQVKITDVASLITANANDYCNGILLRWTAPEALINGAYSIKSDVFSFGICIWEIFNYCLFRPHFELNDDALTQKIFLIYEDFALNVRSECSNNSIYYQTTYDCDPRKSENTKVSHRLTLPQPTICPLEIYGLMLECWHMNEHLRPSFKDITQFLAARKTFALGEHV